MKENYLVYLESLGCYKNTYDSEIMLHSLVNSGYKITENPEEASVLIVNSCSFLSAAMEESISRIIELSDYKKRHQNNLGSAPLLVVVGCLVERMKDNLLSQIPEIDAIMGTSNYGLISSLIVSCQEMKEKGRYHQISTLDSNKKKPRYVWDDVQTSPIAINFKHLRFLKVAEGCSNGCSFCNIPQLRGKQVSRRPNDIKLEFQQFLLWQVKEINILAQNSSSYGQDFKDSEINLLTLIEMLLDTVPDEDYWLRIFYSYPNEYPIELFQLMNEHEQLVEYVDMPFQHINDMVLKQMNRRITEIEIRKILENARLINPNISFRTTFIVGFPTETESQFNQLLEFVQEGWFRHIGVFCYSDEDNIPSQRYGDPIPAKIKQERQYLLLQEQEKISAKHNLGLISTKMRVLVDAKISDDSYQARTASQALEVDGQVLLQTDIENLEGEFIDVEIVDADGYDLIAKPLI